VAVHQPWKEKGATMKTKKKSQGTNAGERESGHDPIRSVPVSDIRPATVNDQLYRPVNPADPEIQALAQSIREIGLQEPLILATDNVIMSGHRRFAACKVASLHAVPCRYADIASTHPDFLRRLRECNRQRVKTADELLREEIVSADPEESYRALTAHRQAVARVKSDTIAIEGKLHRARITAAKRPLLEAILGVIYERHSYWPLTDRQIHYALLNDPPLIHASKPQSRYKNNLASYKAACDIILRARLVGKIPFNAIDDPTRPITTWAVHQHVGPFFRKELDTFLKGYYRDLQQSQPNHIEIIGEKNTIANIIQPVAGDYRIPVTLGRGYCSIPPRHKMAARFRQSGKQQLVLLALSDFDPEGEDIAHSFARSMRDDFRIANIVPVKVALTESQIIEMNLPPILKAKATSSRYEKFTEQYGDDVFELEAVPPAELQTILRRAIDEVLDIGAFNAEVDHEKRDAAYLDGVRRTAQQLLGRADFTDTDGPDDSDLDEFDLDDGELDDSERE
jgi:hypothetical protein